MCIDCNNKPAVVTDRCDECQAREDCRWAIMDGTMTYEIANRYATELGYRPFFEEI